MCSSDLEIINKRIAKIKGKDQFELNFLNGIKRKIEQGEPIRNIKLNLEEEKIIWNLDLLSIKPVIYVTNLNEKDYSIFSSNNFSKIVKQIADNYAIPVVPLSWELENQLSKLSSQEKKIF